MPGIRRRTRRTANTKVFTLGAVCVVAAVVGGGVQAAGIEVPVVGSWCARHARRPGSGVHSVELSSAPEVAKAAGAGVAGNSPPLCPELVNSWRAALLAAVDERRFGGEGSHLDQMVRWGPAIDMLVADRVGPMPRRCRHDPALPRRPRRGTGLPPTDMQRHHRRLRGAVAPAAPIRTHLRAAEYAELAPDWVRADQVVGLIGLEPDQVRDVLEAENVRPTGLGTDPWGIATSDAGLLRVFRSPKRAVHRSKSEPDHLAGIHAVSRDLCNGHRRFYPAGQDPRMNRPGFFARSLTT